VGADADMTLFDPAKVIDRATYQQPTLTSAGIPYVIVGGVPVVDRGQIVPTASPGKGVLSSPRLALKLVRQPLAHVRYWRKADIGRAVRRTDCPPPLCV